MATDTSDSSEPASQRRDESKKERVDRELIELLNEVRVAIPGVQVLFAFLLTVPFAQGFTKVTDFQRGAYFVSLMCAGLASAFLIAPAAQHRMLFRSQSKEALLRRSNRYTYVGIVILAVAISTAVLLIVDYLFGRTRGYVAAGALLALMVWLWVVGPGLRRRRDGTA